jgi:sugar phosphate isomerase/epimerase
MKAKYTLFLLIILLTLIPVVPKAIHGNEIEKWDSQEKNHPGLTGKDKTAHDQTDDNSVQLLKSWQVGTSTGILTDFSQDEFNELKSNGIQYIELGSRTFRDLTQEECEILVEDLKKKADNSGLEIWSLHLPYSSRFDISTTDDENRSNMIKECSRIMALCQPLNIRTYVVHPSAEPIPDDERPIRIENCIASLKILTEEVKKYGAQLALEDLPRTCLGNTSEEILKIVNAVGNGLGICFDSNHLLYEKPEEFVAAVGDLIITLHISDYDGIDERHWLPGTGIINWTNVITELLKHGYSGPFLFETSRRNPASLPEENREERLNSKDLTDCFMMLRNDYLESVSL